MKAMKLNADQGLVAVKTLRAHASASEMDCFTREKEILRKLEHECAPHAIPYLHIMCSFPVVSARTVLKHSYYSSPSQLG